MISFFSGQRSCAKASWFMAITGVSSPPTISSVGARTDPSASSARSGLPPRDTTAATASGGSGAGPEIADFEGSRVGPALNPLCRAGQSLCQEGYVETKLRVVLIDRFFLAGQEIKQQSRDALRLQHLRNVAVPRAVAAAAAPVRKKDDPGSLFWESQSAFQRYPARLDRNFALNSILFGLTTRNHGKALFSAPVVLLGRFLNGRPGVPLQKARHFLVRYLREITVKLADGKKRFGHVQAHQFIHLMLETIAR
jgi:hypothetical protein